MDFPGRGADTLLNGGTLLVLVGDNQVVVHQALEDTQPAVGDTLSPVEDPGVLGVVVGVDFGVDWADLQLVV